MIEVIHNITKTYSYSHFTGGKEDFPPSPGDRIEFYILMCDF